MQGRAGLRQLICVQRADINRGIGFRIPGGAEIPFFPPVHLEIMFLSTDIKAVGV
jgi:hypothetical protein